MTQTKTRQVLIANGVNLDLLGRREPHLYGTLNLAVIEAQIRHASPILATLTGIEVPELVFFQSNVEAEYMHRLSEAWDGAIINAGAWTHTSLALADRLAGLGLPFAEVHLTNLAKREAFRHHSYSAPHAIGVCFGFGAASYLSGLLGLYAHFAKH